MGSLLKLKFLEKLFGKRQFVEPEKLTDERMRKVLGDYTNHTVVYNFDTKKWNRDYYLGYRVMSTGVNCERMKSAIERRLPNVELVAVVGIAAQQQQIKMFNVFPIPAPRNCENPMAYATFITRDRKTGKLNELPQKWVQLSECTHRAFVCEVMPYLLSGIGWTSAPMHMVEWCLDGGKVTEPLISEKEREMCYAKMRKDFMH